jgi:hypothetical protein
MRQSGLRFSVQECHGGYPGLVKADFDRREHAAEQTASTGGLVARVALADAVVAVQFIAGGTSEQAILAVGRITAAAIGLAVVADQGFAARALRARHAHPIPQLLVGVAAVICSQQA